MSIDRKLEHARPILLGNAAKRVTRQDLLTLGGDFLVRRHVRRESRDFWRLAHLFKASSDRRGRLRAACHPISPCPCAS